MPGGQHGCRGGPARMPRGAGRDSRPLAPFGVRSTARNDDGRNGPQDGINVELMVTLNHSDALV
jgi:hypothetical protein